MIEARSLGTRVGSFVLADVTFDLPRGGYGVVIGPAGSGKTTLLETIAGILPQHSGTLRLGDRDVTHVAPEARDVGMVYQHGYLFPHLSVLENIAYGARDAGRAPELASRLGVAHLLAREVRGLSGGERQAVALARALATEPSILLLDEPFSALDPRRRAEVRREVRTIHRERGITVLQVTHDFTEAGLLGNLAILLDAGRALQVGTPGQLFREPATPYIAEFLEAENVLAGTVRVRGTSQAEWMPEGALLRDHQPRAIEFRTGRLTIYTTGDASPGPAHAVIRAGEIILSREAPSSSARNQFEGTVTEIVTVGALARVTVDVQGTLLVATLTTRSAGELQVRVGERVWASFKAMAVYLC